LAGKRFARHTHTDTQITDVRTFLLPFLFLFSLFVVDGETWILLVVFVVLVGEV